MTPTTQPRPTMTAPTCCGSPMLMYDESIVYRDLPNPFRGWQCPNCGARNKPGTNGRSVVAYGVIRARDGMLEVHAPRPMFDDQARELAEMILREIGPEPTTMPAHDGARAGRGE